MADNSLSTDSNDLSQSTIAIDVPLSSHCTPTDSAAKDATTAGEVATPTPPKPTVTLEEERTILGYGEHFSTAVPVHTEIRGIVVENKEYHLYSPMQSIPFCDTFLNRWNSQNAADVSPVQTKWSAMSLEEHKKIYGLLTGLSIGSKVQRAGSKRKRTMQDEDAMYDPVIELYQTLMPEIQHINTSVYPSDSNQHTSRIDFSMSTLRMDESMPFCFIDLPTEFSPHAYQDLLSDVPGLSDDLFDPTSSAQTQSSASSTFTSAAESSSSETSSVDGSTLSTSQVPTSKDAWAHLLDYASEIYGSHPRTCLFYVWIGADHARLLRFDSSGVVASSRFAYVPECADEISPLVYFLLSFAAARPVDRGVDPTVHIIDPNGSAEDKMHIAQLRAHPELRVFNPFSGPLEPLPGEDPESKDFKRKDRAHKCQVERGACYTGTREPIGLRITVYDDGDIAKPIDYLAWCPFRLPYSVRGRRTFAYPAIRRSADADEEPVLLKISNRDVHAKNVDGEIAILKALNERGVKYVPKFVAGGDMPEDGGLLSISRSQEVGKGLQTWRQQRFVITPLCYPLEAACDMEECFGALYNAFEAHEDAYGTDEIPKEQRALHRDISLGNLMLTPTGQGCLIDWDLAILLSTVTIRKGAVGQIGTTGTWYFMATYLLKFPDIAVHGFQEDIESFLWSFSFFLLKHFQFKCISCERLAKIEAGVYAGRDMDTAAGNPAGGNEKSFALQNTSGWLRNMQHPQIPSIAQWIRDISAHSFDVHQCRIAQMNNQEGIYELCRRWVRMEDFEAVKVLFKDTMKVLHETEEGRVEIKLGNSRFEQAAAEDAKRQAALKVDSSSRPSKKRRSSATSSGSPHNPSLSLLSLRRASQP